MFRRAPVRAHPVCIRSAFQRVAPPPLTRWMDAHERIRPRRRASRTPFASTFSSLPRQRRDWVPSWLEDCCLPRLSTAKGALGDAYDRWMPFTRFRRAPAFRSATDAIELAPVVSVCGALHGAPHASATRSRFLQGVLSPAMVALEQPTSDASVTDLPRSGTFSRARTALRFRAWNPIAARADDASRKIGQDRFSRFFVKKERIVRSEAPFIERRPTTAAPLRMLFVGRNRSRGFATATRFPTPLRPARSPALG
jgi:hypothetical protein